jgi:hypothetical protein
MKTPATLALAVLLAPAAAAQSINIDVGAWLSPPSAAYGAAAAQVGAWNDVIDNGPLTLVDLTGTATAADVWALGGNFSFNANHPATFGDDEALLDDLTDGAFTFIFNGLNDGNYDVYTYAWAPDLPTTYLTNVTINGDVRVVGGGDWTGSFIENVHYAKHSVTVSAGTFTMTVDANTGAASCNGIQLVEGGISGCNNPVTYCTAGTSASGCQAALSAFGTPSATAATGFSLVATTVEGDKDGLFFFGTNGRQANPWGNGTSYQCVVPPVKRGGLLPAVGTIGLCDGFFSQDMNARWTAKPSQNPGAGMVVQAQLWHRDPFSSSNQTTSLSEGIEFTVCP